MRPFPWRTLALSLLLTPAPLHAQTGEEIQRCVWGCLARSDGADDPRYSACVVQYCEPRSQSDPAPAPPPPQAASPAPPPASAQPAPPPPPSRWTRADTDAGPAVSLPADVGDSRLTYRCSSVEPGHLIADVPALPPGAPGGMPILLSVEGGPRMGLAPGGPAVWVSPIARSDPLLDALRAGNAASLLQVDGSLIARFDLAGSAAAIGGALAACNQQ